MRFLPLITVALFFIESCRIHFVTRPKVVSRKPVVYLYTQKDDTVSVKLNLTGTLLISEPLYNNGWNVVAHPDGSVTNISDGKHFPYLYWEGTMRVDCDFKTGYVVPGDSVDFYLRKILPKSGLIGKEMDDFIAYWSDDLGKNKLNLISFPTENYEKRAEMEITPKPDNILRVYMAFKEIDQRVIVPEPAFPSFDRTGFYVVEWGGADFDEPVEELE